MAFIALLAAPFLLNHFGSRGIANSYLTQYSETVTVGETFEAFFVDPKWESYKAGAQEYVDFTGKCTYMGEIVTMRITFAVFDDTFNVSNIAVNGIDMSALLWPGFLEAIYSGAEAAPAAANTPNRNEYTSDVPRLIQPPAGGGEQFPPTLSRLNRSRSKMKLIGGRYRTAHIQLNKIKSLLECRVCLTEALTGPGDLWYDSIINYIRRGQA